MKVFESHVTNLNYSGVILIAANNAEEALILAAKKARNRWFFNDYDEQNKLVPKVRDWFSPFEEFPNLTYDTDKPQIILENVSIH